MPACIDVTALYEGTMKQPHIQALKKTEPEAFHRVRSNAYCLVCKARAIEFESDYPSLVEPFASQKVVYCTACGSGTVPGSRSLLKDYYLAEYATLNRGDREAEPQIYFSDKYRANSKTISFYFARAVRHVETLKAFGVQMNDVLDFGSGPGYFLFASNAKNKYAYEPDTMSEKYLKFLGAKRFNGLPEVSSAQYDGIVASHSIEHLVPEDLLDTLSRLLLCLKPNGRILIEIPHGGHSFVHLTAQQDPHTIFFTPEGVIRAITRAGGRVLYHTQTAAAIPLARSNPIYQPTGQAFFSERRGSLVIVAEKAPTLQLKLASWFSSHSRDSKATKNPQETPERSTVMSENTILKVNADKWSSEAQAGELAFHKRPNFRSDEAGFKDGNARLFKSFGYKEDQFVGKTVVDLGAGSKLRGKYFIGSRIVAIEPLASKFIAEVQWCDLSDADEVYSEPAEVLIPQLVGRSDLLFSINVLDHCYDFEKIIGNIMTYLKVGGKACLSFDCHSKVDKLHPIIINEKVATQIFFDTGFQVNQFRRTPSYHKAIADYSITYFMTKTQ